MVEELTENILDLINEATEEENTEDLLNIAKHLTSVAKNLGPKKTREELLPLIEENLGANEQYLFKLAEQLQDFIPLVGGYEYSELVLEILIKLCMTDEPFVRNRAVESLRKLLEGMSEEEVETKFLPNIVNLAADSWFTSKCSAAALYPDIYPKVNDEKKADLRHSLLTLIQDDSVMVRKALATVFLNFISLVDKESLTNELMPVFYNILEDNSESVRVCAIEVAVALGKRLTEAEISEFLIKSIEGWAGDLSRLIRHQLARCLPEIQTVIYHNVFRGKIIALYQKLAKDFEMEIRQTAAKEVFNYTKSLKNNYATQNLVENFQPVFRQSILPLIKLFVEDLNEEVRLAASSCLLDFTTILEGDFFEDTILPVFIKLLRDETSMVIQEQILLSLNQLPDNVDITQSFPSIHNFFVNIINNSQSHWRTRRNLLVAFAHICRFASREFFTENLKQNYAVLLEDPVFAVRRSALLLLPIMIKQYDMEWLCENIIPFFDVFVTNSRYLYRFVPLFGIKEMIAPSLIEENQQQGYLEDFENLVKDSKFDLCWKSIVRISNLKNRISAKLQEQKYKDILSLDKNICDFNKIDAVRVYAEDVVDHLKSSSEYKVFLVDEQFLRNDSFTYIERILFLIHVKFLSVAGNLFDDPIVNIQIRALFIINEIKEFIDRLESEMNQPWVQEILANVSSKEVQNIDKELDELIMKKSSENKQTDKVDDKTIAENNSDVVTTEIVKELDELQLTTSEKPHDQIENDEQVNQEVKSES